MRTSFLLGMPSLAALMLGAAAQAADMPLKAAPPLAPPPLTWNGCYFGGHVGGGWGTKTWRDTGDDFSDNTSYNTNGFLGGAQVGCDYQMWPRVVIGVEGSWSGSNIKGDSVFPFEARSVSINGDTVTQGGGATIATKVNWIATLTGRVGFTVDSALIYVKGGGAWVRERHTTVENEEPDEFNSSSVRVTRSGWLVGTGIEYMITQNWSAKIEYNYMDFGTKNVLFGTITRDGPIADDPASVRQQLHAVKFGLNYRFWGGPAVAGRY
jgi:outer membrane immunogenic protein